MKPIQTVLTLLLSVTLLLGGCAGSGQAESPETPTAPSEETAQPSEPDQAATASEAKETETTQMPETAQPSESDQAATASEGEQTTDVAAAGGQTYDVKMGSDTGQLKYVPETLTVHPGDKIKFVMNKLAPHNVVFDSNGIPSGDKALASSLSNNKLLSTPGETHIVTIPEDAPKGEYNYYCQPHRGAGMNGKLIVE